MTWEPVSPPVLCKLDPKLRGNGAGPSAPSSIPQTPTPPATNVSGGSVSKPTSLPSSESSDSTEGERGNYSPLYSHTQSWGDDHLVAVESEVNRLVSEENVTVRAAYAYLSSKPVALWQEWLISNPYRRLDAAKWLAKQIMEVEATLRRQNP